MIYKLNPPILEKSNYLGYNIGIRPARKTGPRLEKELIKDKIIYHNYGHAGYGVTMSYGACKIVTTMFANEFGLKYKHISIIGSGYMGLHSAKILNELGYSVTIFAKTMPSEWGVFGKSDKKLTSQIAAGKIEPAFLDLFENKQQTTIIYDESIRYIEECYKNKTYKGIHKRDLFMVKEDNPTGHWLDKGYGTIEKCKVTFGNGRVFDAMKSYLYNLDGDVYLNELVTELNKKGVRFVDKEFVDLNDILRLQDTILFNCTGYASKYLFNDPLVFPLKGIMLSFKNTNGYDYYFDSGFTDKIKKFNLYPMNGRVSVGYTWIEEETITKDEDQHIRDTMFQVIEDFKQLFLNPLPKL